MSGTWKKQLEEAKRRLEKQKEDHDRKILEARALERAAKRAIAPSSNKHNPAPRDQGALSSHSAAPASARRPSQPAKLSLPPRSQWPPPREVPRERVLNIGIDYGTSSTKVCARRSVPVQQRDSEPVYVVSFSDQTSGYLCPSSVLVRKGRIFFGPEAERLAKGGTPPYRHLKVCLSCEVETHHHDAGELAECSSDRDSHSGRCTGKFSGEARLTPSQLVTLYLAWVMRESRARLGSALSEAGTKWCSYHIGVPLENLTETATLSRAYVKVTYLAWLLSNGVEQGMELGRALAWYAEAQSSTIPTTQENPVALAPEIAAALVPFINDCVPGSEPIAPGLYGLIDIGAWTTDVALFRLAEAGYMIGGSRLLSFPVGRVRRTGCNHIDDRVRTGLLELVGAEADRSVKLVPMVREHREQGRFGKEAVDVARWRFVPPGCVLDFALAATSGKIWRLFLDTAKSAHSSWQEPYSPARFARFRVFVTGGGSNIEICSRPPDYFSAEILRDTQRLAGTPPTFRLITPSKDSSVTLTVDYRRLAIAHGLAFPAGTWPEIRMPSEVGPVGPPPIKESPTSEDLGYDEK